MAKPRVRIGRLGGDDEATAYCDLVGQALLVPHVPLSWLDREGRENTLVATIRGELVGGLVVQPLGQFFGGRRVEMGGVRAVAVAPEHRGRGIALALVRAALEADRAARRPIAALFPATNAPYRKAGYESAGTWTHWTVPVAALAGGERPLAVRAAGPGDVDGMKSLYAARARRTPGHLDRNAWLWGRVLGRRPGEEKDPLAYVVEGDGGLEGYVVFRQTTATPFARGELDLADLVVSTPRAARQVRAFLGDHRSRIGSARFVGAPFDPWLTVLAEQEHKVLDRAEWMLRVVDVRAALLARGWPEALRGELHLEVRDEVLPWNAGRFVLTVDGGRARVRAGGRGRLRLDVRGLAVLYTGAASAHALALAGLVEGDDDVLASATALFAGPAPWMPDMF